MRKAIYVFSGQGAQSVGMGKDLVEASSAAAIVFDKADSILGWPVSEVCFEGPEEKLTSSQFCQPAIYTMSVACLAAFNERYDDVKPVAVGGLSLGEFAALSAAGTLELEAGLKLVAKRGELMDKACKKTDGAMASVLGAPLETIKNVCAECDVDIANHNSPGQIVISGEKPKVLDAVKMLKERGIRKVIPLKVAGAFHSRLMKEAAAEFAEVLADVELKPPAVPVAQNVTGGFVEDVEEIRANLAKQVYGSVLWENCVKTMAESSDATRVVEFGPGEVLTGLVRRTIAHVSTFNINKAEALDRFE
jgi:[acyl-carrier-protein] S-malonyltransferase